MSYAIIRNANYKMNNLAGLYKHNERKNTNYSNKEILKDKSIKNNSLKNCNTTYTKALNDLIKQYNIKGRIIKTTNVLCEFIITSDKEFFNTIGEEETKRYFETAYKFVADYKNLGEQYIISAKVHNDESTPHLHIVFAPVVKTKDKNGNIINKLACSEYWKGKDSYRQLQDNFHKYIKEHGFDLERGKQREVEHLSTEKLKQVTNFDNIKYEISQNEIQPLKTKNNALLIQQNQELIKYVNKLKVELSKSYIAIQKSITLEEENKKVIQENIKLHKENKLLRRYIDKTYEYISYLINIPKNSIRNMINQFFKELKEKE
ncbi:MAG: plasmid recombination protein [Clostridia bacterium]